MAAIADRHYHRHHHQPANPNPPTRRSSGRRKAKGGEKKVKQPQRGMGVEKLERLRVQEDLMKMAEAAPPPLPDPVQKIDGFGSPAHGTYLNFQYGQVDLIGPKCYAGHCTSCHKKKKFNGGECGFVGANNLGEYQKIEMVQPTTVRNIGKQGGVEVVAVHRKGGGRGSSFGDGGVMMEYEFFPIAGKSDVHEDGEQGLVVMNFMRDDDYGFDDGVDLSLKL